jgi:SAM-dependent methyltransferase
MARVFASEALHRHYADRYAGPSEWRRLGALDKALNVVRLCGRVPHRSLLEIGAGEGALLQRLSELGFAEELHALEISPSGIQAIRTRGIEGLAEALVFDGYAVPYDDGRFDLAVLSHVLEHVEHPRQLLREAARVASHVFVEVPLEDTWRLPRDFVPDPVGHINFYSAKSVRRLLQSCGLVVLEQRISHPPRATYEYRLGAGGRWRYWIKELALRGLPGLATHLWTYHAALLCSAR